MIQKLEERMNPTEPWLSVEEIARHLALSKETIYRWLENGSIPSHRVGKLWRFKATEVDNWITKGGAEDSPTASKVKSKSPKNGN